MSVFNGGTNVSSAGGVNAALAKAKPVLGKAPTTPTAPTAASSSATAAPVYNPYAGGGSSRAAPVAPTVPVIGFSPLNALKAPFQHTTGTARQIAKSPSANQASGFDRNVFDNLSATARIADPSSYVSPVADIATDIGGIALQRTAANQAAARASGAAVSRAAPLVATGARATKAFPALAAAATVFDTASDVRSMFSKTKDGKTWSQAVLDPNTVRPTSSAFQIPVGIYAGVQAARTLDDPWTRNKNQTTGKTNYQSNDGGSASQQKANVMMYERVMGAKPSAASASAPATSGQQASTQYPGLTYTDGQALTLRLKQLAEYRAKSPQAQQQGRTLPSGKNYDALVARVADQFGYNREDAEKVIQNQILRYDPSNRIIESDSVERYGRENG
jgi:hypothetical protein